MEQCRCHTNGGVRGGRPPNRAARAGGRCQPLAMDRWPDRGARDRGAARPARAAAAGWWGNGPLGRPTQRDGGYVTTESTSTPPPDRHWRPCPPIWIGGGRAGCTLRACSARFGSGSRRRAPARRCSSGSARSADVDRYLAGVNHTVITEFWKTRSEAVAGGTPRSAPGTQNFWVASDSGPGHGPGVGAGERIVDRRRDEC